jgi:hypothetical protein
MRATESVQSETARNFSRLFNESGYSNNGSCHVAGWGTGGADFTATVNCYGGGGTGGVLKDSAFDLLFVW